MKSEKKTSRFLGALRLNDDARTSDIVELFGIKKTREKCLISAIFKNYGAPYA